MAEKTSAEVIIGGKVYTLSGYEGEEYLQKVATYINNKLGEFQGMEELRHLSGDMKATLLQLNIADDYFKAKTQVEKLEREIEQKEKEIYDLKHDLISNQIKAESDEKAIQFAFGKCELRHIELRESQKRARGAEQGAFNQQG